jgi:anti-sigma regulatory factor (Ser/Thr protein kinase)
VTGELPQEPLALAPVGQASREARAYVRHGLTALGWDTLLDSAELAVTELVTNACLHARTPIVVALRVLADHSVRIEVTDESPRVPEQQHFDTMATTGRGLRLLESYGRWGVDTPAPPLTGKTVWFEPSEDSDSAAVWDTAELGDWADLL